MPGQTGRVSIVNASNVRMGGCAHTVKSSTDVEPVIEVPVQEMGVL